MVYLCFQIGPGEPYAYRVPGSESKPGANQTLPFLQGLVLSLPQQALRMTGSDHGPQQAARKAPLSSAAEEKAEEEKPSIKNAEKSCISEASSSYSQLSHLKFSS